MKAKQVLSLLRVTRATLCRYVKQGVVKVRLLPNKDYDYDEESVYKLMNKNVSRQNVIYARVSTAKQKQDLENQIDLVKQFAFKNGIIINDIYSDIGSGINFDRKQFQRLINNVVEHKISKVYITYKDRLSRISFDVFKNLFSKFNCEIVVLNEIDDEKLIEKEIFTEIVNLIHCFSMKMYSSRRKEKLKLVEKELKQE